MLNPIKYLITIAAVAAVSTPSRGAELKVFTSRAVATVLKEIGNDFEQGSGHKLNVVVDLSPNFAKRIQGGERFDVFVSLPNVIDNQIKAGKLEVDTKVPLVKSGTAVEVRKGAPKPDVSTVEKFKDALLGAKSVGYLPTSGVPELVEKLGLTDRVKPKASVPNIDIVSEQVAKGEVELGIVVLTQVLTTPGVELAGMLPEQIQIYVRFVGAVASRSENKEAARALLTFLAGPKAAPVIKKQGMEQG